MDTPGFDILILGTGAAGSYAAMQAASMGAKVALVTKTKLLSGSTRWAQGGVAFPSDPNDIPSHLLDTVKAGRGLVDENISRQILTESLTHLERLLGLGVNFDETPALEGGHSVARVRHINGDESGLHLLMLLHSQLPSQVAIFENHFAARLEQKDGAVTGAILWNNGDPHNSLSIKAHSTLIATGGIGRLYPVTTNPPESTGDGIALAYRVGAVVRDMELVQFHPTVLANGGLISEACRGEGAILINAEGERFMFRYDRDGELAPRDIVSRSIYREASDTGQVYLDLRPIANLAEKFPTVFQLVSGLGYDPATEPIPIFPAAHYLMGGIRTAKDGTTSVNGLFAAGEAASTGFHGANRLASNSLLESLVMGARAAFAALSGAGSGSVATSPGTVPGCSPSAANIIRTRMQGAASVIRNGSDLQDALSDIRAVPTGDARSVDEAETANMRLVALLVLLGAIERRESRGSHVRSDFPRENADPKHIERQLGPGSPAMD